MSGVRSYIDLGSPSIGPDSALRLRHRRIADGPHGRDIRNRIASPRRQHGRCLHALRQMRRGLPGDRARPASRRRAARGHRRRHRHPAHSATGTEAARKWANSCVLSGECIKACDYGVNPRFLLGMARVAMARAKDDVATQRRGGVDGFRKVARDVTHISRMQLDDALLARLGQGARQASGAAGEPPGFRVLHRLQRAQDAAHRAACARHHGCARRHLSRSWAARRIAAAWCRCAPAMSRPPAAWPRARSTSCAAARPGRCSRGARRATCSSPRRRCRRSRRRAARSRSR